MVPNSSRRKALPSLCRRGPMCAGWRWTEPMHPSREGIPHPTARTTSRPHRSRPCHPGPTFPARCCHPSRARSLCSTRLPMAATRRRAALCSCPSRPTGRLACQGWVWRANQGPAGTTSHHPWIQTSRHSAPARPVEAETRQSGTTASCPGRMAPRHPRGLARQCPPPADPKMLPVVCCHRRQGVSARWAFRRRSSQRTAGRDCWEVAVPSRRVHSSP
mmetsp:Transcript_31443/g.94495  ORF Transcript_31443/g.94495 Transcript_31443/m.94495 type:complete len:218 (+) Transcript_31443:168-821(+)